MVAFHLAIVQGHLAGFVRDIVRTVIEGAIRQLWAMRTAFARIRWYRVLAGLAHGRLAGRDSILVADASDTVVLFPFVTEFPRDALMNAVLRFLFDLCPGDRI